MHFCKPAVNKKLFWGAIFSYADWSFKIITSKVIVPTLQTCNRLKVKIVLKNIF